MKRILLDVNVILDILLDRNPRALAAAARRTVDAILQVLDVAGVDGGVLRRAVRLGWSDFEDAVTTAAAEAALCEAIVSRDPKGFRTSPVRVISPDAAAALLGSVGQ
jgi:predicted nucleic acid-binding protein